MNTSNAWMNLATFKSRDFKTALSVAESIIGGVNIVSFTEKAWRFEMNPDGDCKLEVCFGKPLPPIPEPTPAFPSGKR